MTRPNVKAISTMLGGVPAGTSRRLTQLRQPKKFSNRLPTNSARRALPRPLLESWSSLTPKLILILLPDILNYSFSVRNSNNIKLYLKHFFKLNSNDNQHTTKRR
uniref:Uncharacterized protein n=1 Tax=Cacopsylla melanoneura TaxID=428564 RepID=A0A8D8TN25_9HEMI